MRSVLCGWAAASPVLVAALLVAAAISPSAVSDATTVDGPMEAVSSSMDGPASDDVSVEPVLVRAASAEAARVEEVRSDDDDRTRRFAQIDEVTFRLPTRDVIDVGFHEGATGSKRMGPLSDDEVAMRTMPSRGRAASIRSAVDVAVEPQTPVLSPVSGTVKSVSHYSLYSKYPDALVEIAPAADPSATVRVLHVEDVEVEAGQRVVGGQTPVAGSARQLPFPSQIDEWAGPVPHVHVEMVD